MVSNAGPKHRRARALPLPLFSLVCGAFHKERSGKGRTLALRVFRLLNDIAASDAPTMLRVSFA